MTVEKELQGDVAGASTEFTVDLDRRGTAYDHIGIVLNEANGWTRRSPASRPGSPAR